MANVIERRVINSIPEWLEWRRHDVTASVVACLFGEHEYKTIFELWSEITSGVPVAHKETKLMRRGRRWEPVVCEAVRDERPDWKLRKANVYLRDPSLKLGATPDFFLTLPTGARGVLQSKIVNPAAFRQKWTETTAPKWIVLQTLTEMMLARATFGVIAALEIGPYDEDVLHLYEVPRHPVAEKRIKDAVIAFWRAIAAGEVPKPDYARDGALIAAMHAQAKKGSVIDLRGDNRMPQILSDRARVKAEIAEKEAVLKALDTEIKDKIGENEIALVNGWTVKVPQINVDAYVREVKAYSYRKIDAKRDEAAPEPMPAKEESAA